MSHDSTIAHGQERDRIALGEPSQVLHWCESLNTTPQRLIEAVKAVGDRVGNVRQYLRDHPSHEHGSS